MAFSAAEDKPPKLLQRVVWRLFSKPPPGAGFENDRDALTVRMENDLRISTGVQFFA